MTFSSILFTVLFKAPTLSLKIAFCCCKIATVADVSSILSYHFTAKKELNAKTTAKAIFNILFSVMRL